MTRRSGFSDGLRRVRKLLGFLRLRRHEIFDAACLDDDGTTRGIAQDLLTLGHRFRDGALERTPESQRWVQLYYQLSDEAVAISTGSPRLLRDTAQAIADLSPRFQELVVDGRTSVDAADLARVDRLLQDYARLGSTRMREAIDIVRLEIADPRVQQALGVTVRP